MKEIINSHKVEYDLISNELKNKNVLIHDIRKQIVDLNTELIKKNNLLN